MCILALSFLLSIGFCTWVVWLYSDFINRHTVALSRYICITVNLALSFIIIGAYIFILYFVYGRSKAISYCKRNGSKDFKRLTKTIMLIFVSQAICSLPNQFIWFTVTTSIMSLPTLLTSLGMMLRNNSCLFEGIILPLRERNKKENKMKIEQETGFSKI